MSTNEVEGQSRISVACGFATTGEWQPWMNNTFRRAD
jgi:hypothetical protein